jgi:biotin-dependent carboxylase-like uncharacterized protein
MGKQVILNFKRAGLYTTIQDMGRTGYQHFGVSIGGVMDKSSAKIANWLVGNEEDKPVLEITLLGPSIVFKGKCQIALTGANLSATINGVPIVLYKTIQVKNGAVLDFGKVISGCRSYLAIGGLMEVPQWLSSYSAASMNPKEVTPKSIMSKDSQLVIATNKFISKRKYSKKKRPVYGGNIRVSLLPGPEFEMFSRSCIAYFFSQSYSISNQSNRMGYRLEGGDLQTTLSSEIISSGIVPGTIQITNSGQPLILMMDAQTVGGYSRIANIVSQDLDKVAQLKPGDKIWFSLLSLKST